ncbi:hypothetical protein WI75_25420 [Burkholderia ubonensis]|nr:hypothetical protein WI75_25420 [Burkholderia ubonensis]
MAQVDVAARTAVAEQGLDALRCESVWAEFEGAAFQLFDDRTKIGNISRALQLCASIHFEQPDLRPPGELVLRFGHTEVSRLYRVSTPFLLTYRRLLLAIDARAATANTARYIKHNTYAILGRLIQHTQARDLLALRGFDAFSDLPDQLMAAAPKVHWQDSRGLRTLLTEYDPPRWRRKTVALFGKVDLTALHACSPVIYEEVRTYAEWLAACPLRGRCEQTVKDRLSLVKRGLLRSIDLLPPADAIRVRMYGLRCFVENDAVLLSWLYQHNVCAKRDLSIVREVADALFPECSKPDEFFTPYRITFSNPYAERPIYCDYGPIRDISIALYEDLTGLLAEQKALLEQSTINTTTLYHHFVQFKAALMLLRAQLGEEPLRLLREHGMRAFGLPGNRVQKEVFAQLQNAVRTGALLMRTAYTYRKSLEWFIVRHGFEVAGAYPMSVHRTTKHLARLNTDDYYSAKQCREIAFHVECLLLEADLSVESRLSLMLARVLLKTGWTLSQTLGIRCDDIARVSTPLNPHGCITVVTQKARAGYRSDAWSFADPPRGTAVRSAAADLMLVRDELTAPVRAQLPDSHPYRPYVFIFERNGQVERLPMAATKNITTLLKRRGCTLSFDSKKIRKGGMNHIYRRLQGDLQDYEAVAGHSFATFESHYCRIDENQSRYSLGRAIDVMGRYFIGKEISADIVILTETGNRLQHTPTGECASRGNDPEAALYNREHRKLHERRGATTRFCADFLSCVWCRFFRVVADPEHVWKLLSYREYVLFEMQATVIDSDGPDDQRTHIEILRARVEQILERLDIVAPGVTAAGEVLLRERGMHPDWSFALVDAPCLPAANGHIAEN